MLTKKLSGSIVSRLPWRSLEANKDETGPIYTYKMNTEANSFLSVYKEFIRPGGNAESLFDSRYLVDMIKGQSIGNAISSNVSDIWTLQSSQQGEA